MADGVQDEPSTSSRRTVDDRLGSSSRRRDESLSPRKKRKQTPFTVTEKEMILNVYKYVYTEKKTASPTETPRKGECLKKCAEILGISKTSIDKVLKEHKENENFTSPVKSGPKANFKDKLDDFDLTAIRRKVHEFFYRNEAPTVKKVLAAVNDDPDLPTLSRTKMYKILKHLNFKYLTKKRNSTLIDRQDIILWRHRYLQNIKQYRREGRFIYYQDETWINEGHTTKNAWVDNTILTSRQAFLEGLTTGLKGPTGKGRRLVVSHVGSEEGFVEDGLLIFEAKKGHDDYHKEMDAEKFEKWINEILSKLKDNSILVLDNAPYHSRKLEAIPTSNWRKVRIQEWLTSKNITFEETMLKAQLLELVRREKKAYERYVVDDMAAKRGITILRLPPYHCELNSIELIWAQVKGYVARNNKTFKLTEVRNLFEEGLREVTAQRWSDCIAHTIKVEDRMCQLDGFADDVTDRFIIEVGDDTSNKSEEEFSDESESE